MERIDIASLFAELIMTDIMAMKMLLLLRRHSPRTLTWCLFFVANTTCRYILNESNEIKMQLGFSKTPFENLFRNFHSISTLKCRLLDHIVEDVRRLGYLAYTAVDHFESSHKQNKQFYEASSERIESAGARQLLNF